MKRTKKHMLIGLMLCGALAFAGGVAALNAYDGESVAVRVSAEESAFSEVATGISKIHLRSKRLLLFLDACDYANTGGTTVVQASYADCNMLEKIQVYVGDTCVTLGEALERTSGDTNVYYNVWGETGSISFPLIPSSYTAANVTKIVIPAGTQFPSYAYTNGDGSATAYATSATYIFTNNDFSNPDWSVDWSVSVEYPPIDFAETATTVSIHAEYYSNNRIGFLLGTSDYSVATHALSLEKLKALNTLTSITYNDKALGECYYMPDALADPNIYLRMFDRQNTMYFPVEQPVEGDVIKIAEGTQFPSYAFVSEGAATCYTTTEDVKYVLEGGAWKKAVNVTINGETQEMLCGNKITKPETPADYEENGYQYTVVWYVAGTDTVYDFDAALAADVAIESKYSSAAIEYTVTFAVNGETVDTATYTVENKEITEPAVPEKAGYTGAWEAYELTTGDITVNAVYEAIQYTITFMADDEVVGTATYAVEDKDNIVEPAVPEKEGYTGAWEAYELTTGDITVKAVYTEIPVEPEEPEEDKKDKKKGCGSSLGLGVAGALTAVGAALVIKKRKED